MDLYDDPDFRKFRTRVLTDLVPKLGDSRVVMSLVPEGETDIKFAVELGLSVMMDKPIIAVVRPGVKVPAKLALVVDKWIEGDVSTEEGRQLLMKTLDAMYEELDD